MINTLSPRVKISDHVRNSWATDHDIVVISGGGPISNSGGVLGSATVKDSNFEVRFLVAENHRGHVLCDMVLQKRLDYGFVGYQVPWIPQAKRSARRRVPIKKKVEDNPLQAFDLLATVAGKLLLEGENSVAVKITGEDQEIDVEDEVQEENESDEFKPPGIESLDKGSSRSNLFVKEPGFQADTLHNSCAEPDVGCLAAVTTDHLSKVSSFQNIVQNNDENELKILPSKIKGSVHKNESSLYNLEGHVMEQQQCIAINNGQVSFQVWPDLCSAEDPMILDGKPPVLISSDSCAKVSLSEDHYQRGPLSLCRDNVTLVSRDDDENSSGCTQRSTTMAATRLPRCSSELRIKNPLAFEYSAAAPKLKDGDLSDSGGDSASAYHNRKSILKRQRSQRIYPPKKRKVFNYSSGSSCDGISALKRTYELPLKAADITASDHGVKRHGGMFLFIYVDFGSSSSVDDQKASFGAKEPHVKLRIKSFRVPELLIEISETETVASLKRTVMEAVSAMLEDGLRAGILFQGRKIRDDNRTLIQTGISHDSRLDALSFTLEPYASQAVAPVTCEGPLQPSSVPQPLTKCLPTISRVQQDVLLPSADIPSNNLSLGTAAESDRDSAPSPPEVVEKSTYDSRALVPIPEANVKPLTVIPMQKKSKETEIGQRRIRRPFSVSEVEALVQAVEKLGTGRWRDVKLRAFDNVKHRTYVDLKVRNRISGKHWCTLRGSRPSRGGESQCRKSCSTGSLLPMHIGPNTKSSSGSHSSSHLQRPVASSCENFLLTDNGQILTDVRITSQGPQLKPPPEACRLLL
ncbi:Telomere repeat-binding protein 5-like protein [Drosera capensis]